MLLFSTVLPINDSLTKDEFIKLAIKWNQGGWPENIIPGIEWNGERNIRYGNDKLWMQIEEYRNENIIAIRYEKTEDDGVIWDTDYVMNFNDMKMSIRLDRSFLEEALTMYSTFHTPAFIALLIDGGYVRDDDGLPVRRVPTMITKDNLGIAAEVINREKRYDLPVVYISKTNGGEDPVNIKEVAKRLKGVAHVFVQDNISVGELLRQQCPGKNVYNGAIGIYYPNAAAGHDRFLNHIYEGSYIRMAEKVISRVIQYSNSQRIDPLYTWHGVMNSLLRDKYSCKREELAAAEAARRDAETVAIEQMYAAEIQVQNAAIQVQKMKVEAEAARSLAEERQDMVDSVDDEIQEMRQQIADLTRQNDALQAENQGLWTKLREMSGVPILYLGSEEEFFPGEIKEFVMESLDGALKATKHQTRRADVLGDLIRSNGGVTGALEEKRKKVKDLLFHYTAMTKPVKNGLKGLGFTITEEGKHYKLVYYGDGRYWSTMDKTPSDKAHGGKNGAMAIIKDMF